MATFRPFVNIKRISIYSPRLFQSRKLKPLELFVLPTVDSSDKCVFLLATYRLKVIGLLLFVAILTLGVASTIKFQLLIG